MKHQQKYFTEVAIAQATNGVLLINPVMLDDIKNFSKDTHSFIEKSHIYFICQRARIRITKASSRTEEGIWITLNVAFETGNTNISVLISDEKLTPECSSVNIMKNGTHCALTNGDKNVTFWMPPEYFFPLLCKQHPELINFKVLYIGQSYDSTGKRSVIDRLKSHSTLQKILAKQIHDFPWSEVIILLFSYADPTLVTKMDGQGTPQIVGEEDRKRFKSVYDEPLSKTQLITIAEASLIRYFNPYYNIYLKGNYPTSSIKHLNDAYRLDYNAIITEIDTEDIYVNTFTDSQKAKNHHIAEFDLHDKDDRLSFFELLKNEVK